MKRLLSLILLAVSLVSGFLVTSALPGQAAEVGTGSISGVVTADVLPDRGEAAAAALMPVSGASVVVSGSEGGGDTVTAADGSYQVTGLAPGLYSVTIAMPSIGLVTWQRTNVVVGDGEAVVVDATMVQGGAVGGRVTDPDGIGVPGVSISVNGPGHGYGTTDASGNFSIDGLAPGIYTASFDPGDSSMLMPATRNDIQVDGARTTPVDVQLRLGGSVTGTVRDADGAAIGGASVSLSGAGYGSTTTAADGTYTVRGLPSGVYTASFGMPGYVATTRSGIEVVTGSATTVDATLRLGGTITGTVTDADGVAIPGVGVTVNESPNYYATVYTDASGQYTLTSVPPSTYTVSFDKSGSDYLRAERSGVEVIRGAATTLNVKLQLGGSIAGTVTVAEGGSSAPLEGAVVYANGESGTTSATGEYSVIGLAPGTYTVDFSKSGTTLAPERRTVSVVSGTTTDVDVELTEGGILTGTLTDQSGPVEDVQVSANVSNGFGSGYGSSDSAGVFTLAGLPSGTYTITFSKTGLVPQSRIATVVLGQTTTVDVSFTSGVEVSGTVRNQGGDPLAGVTVRAYPGDGSGYDYRSTMTDSEGRYTISGLVAGAYTMRYIKISSNYGPLEQSTLLSGAVTTVDAVLPPGGRLVGTVTDPEGDPVANVSVSFSFPQSTFNSYWFSIYTDSDGRYVIPGLPAGTASLTFTKPGFVAASRTATVTPPDNTTVDVQLSRGGRISGTVTDADGDPVGGVQVGASLSGGYGFGYANAVTADDGTYTMSGVAPGTYSMNFSKQGSDFAASSRSGVAVTAGATTTVDVTLQLGGTVSGVVSGTDGPLGGVYVSATSPDAGGAYATTDAAGQYALRGLAPGVSYTVSFSKSGSDYLQANQSGVSVTAGGTTTLNHTMQLGGTVSGVVSGTDGPLSGVQVRAMPFSGGSVSGTSDANGAYALRGLQPGAQYTVTFEKTGSDYTVSSQSGVTVTSGGTTTLNITLQVGGSVSGIVSGSDGPLAGVWVSGCTSSGTWSCVNGATTDATGAYTLRGLRPGAAYDIDFTKSGSDYSAVERTGVTVTAGGTTTLNVTMPLGGSITGVVSGADGPLDGVSVFANTEGGGSSGYATSNASGEYALRGLVPGQTYSVRFIKYSSDYAPLTRSGLSVTAGGSLPLNVTLPLGGTVSGVVTGADGPLSGVSVGGCPSVGGNCLANATTGADGTYTLRALEPGVAYQISFNKSGSDYVSLSRTNISAASGATTTLNVTMERGGTVSGIVSGPDGPIAGVSVSGCTTSGAWACLSGVWTDATGSYTLRGLLPGSTYRLTFSKSGSDFIGVTRDNVTAAAGGTTTLNVTMQVGGSIRGTVRDGSGQPVSGAYVNASAAQSGSSATTAADGTYEIRGLAPSTTYSVYAEKWGSDFIRTTVSNVVVAGGQATVQDLTLQIGAKIGGTVRGVGGVGLPGVSVYAYAQGMYSGYATTDANGVYQIRGLQAGTYSLSFNANGSNYMQGRLEAVTVAAQQDLGGQDVTLQRYASIEGTLTGAPSVPAAGDGTPIQGAEIIIRSTDPNVYGYGRVRTSATGAFRFPSVSPGTYQLYAKATGDYMRVDLPSPLAVGNGEAVTGVDLVAPLGGSIVGTITGATAGAGAPEALEGAQVYIYGKGIQSRRATTDVNGSFTIRHLPTGSFWLQVSKSGSPFLPTTLETQVPVVLGQRTTQDVTLERGGRIVGRAVDGSGNPIANVDVVANEPGAGLGYGTAVTDGNGRFVIQPLTAGTYDLSLSKYGSPFVTTLRTGVAVTLGDEADAGDVEMLRGGSVAGTVTGTGGVAVVGATIEAVSQSGGGTYRAVTGAGGSYVIEGLPTGTYKVTAGKSSDGYVRTPAPSLVEVVRPGAVENVNISLTVSGGATGRVLGSDSAPLSGVYVQARKGGSYYRDHTDNDGVYSFTGMRPGTYSLTFTKYGSDYAPQVRADAAVVVAGETTQVSDTTMQVGGSISGTVTLPAGSNSYVDINASGPNGGSYASRSGSGSYTLRGLPAGAYTVTFYVYGLGSKWWNNALIRSQATPVTVNMGDQVTGIDITFAAVGSISGTVSGTVPGSADAPLSRAYVEVTTDTGDYVRGTSSQANGAFSVSGLQPGTYLVKVSKRGFATRWFDGAAGRATATPVIVAAGSDRALGQIVLPGGGEIAGTTTTGSGADSQPVPGASVDIFDASSGDWVDDTWTDRTGSYVMRGLESGSYDVRFRKAGYATEWWNDTPDQATATDVPVTLGQRVSDVSAVLTARDEGSVAGRVTGTGQGGLGDVTVSVFDAGGSKVDDTVTDATGDYVIRALAAGSYTVEFTPAGSDWIGEWFDDKPTRLAADVVAVVANDTRSGVSAELSPATAVTHTVTYAANGGSGQAPPSHSYAEGATVTVAGRGDLARDGFTFAGWNTATDGSGTSYQPGATFVMGPSDVTLNAMWTPIPVDQFQVQYLGNGATSGSGPADATYAAGTEVTIAGSETLARTGYTFGGWSTTPTGVGGTSYQPGATLIISGPVTLYAQWVAVQYDLKYRANGATSGEAPATTQHVAGSIVAAAGQGNLLRTGYAFGGWSTQQGGGGTVFQAGGEITIPVGGLTLYAVWTPVEYTLSFNGNGNTGGAVPASGSHVAGDRVTLPQPGTLVRDGFTFAGWATQANGGSALPAGSQFTMPAADQVLFAQWSAVPTYAVSYDGNGATGGSVPAGASFAQGASVTVAGAGSLVRDGFTFAGWNTAANGSGTSWAVGSTFSMPGSAVTLFAQWTQNPAPEPATSSPAPAPETSPPAPAPAPSTSSPAPQPSPSPTELKPGSGTLVVDGQAVPVTVTPDETGEKLVLSGGGVTIVLDSVGTDGKPLPLASDGSLLISQSGTVLVQGSGFAPFSTVVLYMFSEPIALGTFQADANGNVSVNVPVPAGIVVGSHTVQAVGQTSTGEPLALSVGVTVTAKQAQVPAKAVKLPKSLKVGKVTTLVKGPIKTNAGQTAKVAVTCGPLTKSSALLPSASKKYCQVIKKSGGVMQVKVLKKGTKVTVRLTAPETPKYLAYAYTKVYSVKK